MLIMPDRACCNTWLSLPLKPAPSIPLTPVVLQVSTQDITEQQALDRQLRTSLQVIQVISILAHLVIYCVKRNAVFCSSLIVCSSLPRLQPFCLQLCLWWVKAQVTADQKLRLFWAAAGGPDLGDCGCGSGQASCPLPGNNQGPLECVDRIERRFATLVRKGA